ncbi:DUF3333 domain-containing protein, partial [Loktanella salsilacus]
MTDLNTTGAAPGPRKKTSLMVQDARTKKRNAAEKRFRLYGVLAIGIAVLALVTLLASVLINGSSAFRQTFITMDIYLDPAKLDKKGTGAIEDIAKVSTFGYAPLIQQAFETVFEKDNIGVEGMTPKTAAEL